MKNSVAVSRQHGHTIAYVNIVGIDVKLNVVCPLSLTSDGFLLPRRIVVMHRVRVLVSSLVLTWDLISRGCGST